MVSNRSGIKVGPFPSLSQAIMEWMSVEATDWGMFLLPLSLFSLHIANILHQKNLQQRPSGWEGFLFPAPLSSQHVAPQHARHKGSLAMSLGTCNLSSSRNTKCCPHPMACQPLLPSSSAQFRILCPSTFPLLSVPLFLFSSSNGRRSCSSGSY